MRTVLPAITGRNRHLPDRAWSLRRRLAVQVQGVLLRVASSPVARGCPIRLRSSSGQQPGLPADWPASQATRPESSAVPPTPSAIFSTRFSEEA